ncbi:MAG: hypothetical protein WC969_08035 [Elusimicrobiota bacterium]|jgi:hypothetical protein
MEHDKSARGNSSQFFVAGELCRRGYAAVVTMGNTPNTDVLCSNRAGTKFVHIQVKTFIPGTKTCSVGLKAEKNFGENFFWVLAGIPERDSTSAFEHFIIPSADMARNVHEFHKRWLAAPGKSGQAHKNSTVRAVNVPPNSYSHLWTIEPYRDQWKFIDEKLAD